MKVIGQPRVSISLDKATITFLSSSASCFIIAALLFRDISKLVFLLYTISIILLAIILFKRNLFYERAVVMKTFIDLSFTTYLSFWCLLHLGNAVFYFLPVIIILFYGKFNLYSFKKRIIEVLLLIYLFLNGLYPFYALSLVEISIPVLTIYFSASFYAIWLYVRSAEYGVSYNTDTQSMISKLILHDLVNAQQLLNFSIGSTSNIKTIKLAELSREKLIDAYNLVKGGRSHVKFYPLRIINTTLPLVINSIESELELFFSLPLFVSITKNIYDNAAATATRNGRALQFRISSEDEVICYEDNAGGSLDIRDILDRNTNKQGDDHGYFLYSLLFQKRMYDIDAWFENYSEGVKIFVKFGVSNSL